MVTNQITWDNLTIYSERLLDETTRNELELSATNYSPMVIMSAIHRLLQEEILFKEFEVQVWLINTLAKYKDGVLVDFVKPNVDFPCSDKTATIIRNTVWQLST